MNTPQQPPPSQSETGAIGLRLGRELLPLMLAGLGLGMLYLGSGRPVQLLIDGEAQLLHTHSRQVGRVLEEAGIDLGSADRVAPELASELVWPGAAIVVESARPVVMAAGQTRELIRSPERSAANLLAEFGWTQYPGDRLTVDGIPAGAATSPVAPGSVRLDQAVELTVADQGVRRILYSAAPTVGAALVEAGIELRHGDRLRPEGSTPLEGPLSVEIKRGQPLVIQFGSAELRSHSAADTVAEALAEAGVPLLGLDYTVPAADESLPADGQIRVVRVTETVIHEQEALPYETLYQPLESLEIDQQQVVEAGSYGVRTNRIRVRLEDGEEVSRVVEGDWTAHEPSPQIVGYGTQIVIRTVSTEHGPLDYWRAVEMYATSYSPSRAGVSPDSPWFGITASGKPLVKGLVAIDRNLIPFGTQMYVPGYGFAEAADTGSGVRGRWIDLGYEDDNWVGWSGYVTVYFLTPVPSNIVYVFP